MVTDEEARRAVEFLIDSSAEYAAAVADHERLCDLVKVTLAHEIDGSDGPISAREHSARASKAYRGMLDERHKARLDAERLRALRHAAGVKVEVWRTHNANTRRLERGFGSAS